MFYLGGRAPFFGLVYGGARDIGGALGMGRWDGDREINWGPSGFEKSIFYNPNWSCLYNSFTKNAFYSATPKCFTPDYRPSSPLPSRTPKSSWELSKFGKVLICFENYVRKPFLFFVNRFQTLTYSLNREKASGKACQDRREERRVDLRVMVDLGS